MLDGLAARNGGRAGLAALVAIVLLGLGLRAGEAWDGRPPVYDAAAYAAIAANLERGEGFTVGAAATQPSSNYSPGLPLLVAGLYELSGGPHERLARLLLAALGTLAIPLAYLLARRLARLMHSPPYREEKSSLVAGLIAAAVVAVYPALLEYQGMLMSEPLAATLLAGAVLAVFWAADGYKGREGEKGSDTRDEESSGARVLSRGEGGAAGALVLGPPPPAPPARGTASGRAGSGHASPAGEQASLSADEEVPPAPRDETSPSPGRDAPLSSERGAPLSSGREASTSSGRETPPSSGRETPSAGASPSGGWRGRGDRAEEASATAGAVGPLPRQDPPAGAPSVPRRLAPRGCVPRRSVLRWLLPGVLFGALAMVRPEYLGVTVLLAVVVFATGAWGAWVPGRDGARGGWPRALGAAAVMLAAAAVVVAPWTVRNAEALGRFVPISTGGGQVLFAGTYLPSDGNPERVGAEVVARHPRLFGPRAVQRLRLEQILARLAAARHPGLEADQALTRMGREQLWDDVSERPLTTAGFVARKLWRVWGHGPRQVMREPGWALLHWALAGLGLLGLGLLAWRRRWEAAVLATVLLAITALGAVLVASPRRLLVAMPLLAACAGVGVAWIAAAWRERRRPAGAGAARAG